MHFFTNCQIEIYEPSDGEVCEYTGEPKDVWTKIGTYDADFQNERSADSQTSKGLFLEDVYTLFVDLTVPITHQSRIKIVGDTSKTYEVIGTPKKHNLWLDYTRVDIQVQRNKTI